MKLKVILISSLMSLTFLSKAYAEKIDPKVLELGKKAYQCATKKGLVKNDEALTIIDYSKPSDEKRMWVIDVDDKSLMSNQYVSHGSGSGGKLATEFSNINGSHQTSLGVFITDETYTGKNGLSLRLDGVEKGVNDNARDRAIVIHGADYVSKNFIDDVGRLGRSQGCPALEEQYTKKTIDYIKDGSVVLAYYPDQDWLKNSELLTC